MTKREKVYLKDTALWGSIDHEGSSEMYPETYARLDSLTHGSNKKLVWKCSSGHSWGATINNRSHGNGCPFCSGRRVSDINRLSIRNPEVAREWDFDKNKLTPDEVAAFSNKKVWWKCSVGHSWDERINIRSRGIGCPFCSGRRVSDINRLSIRNPEVAREWDFDKNELTPDDVSVASHKKAWWKCSAGHSWQTQIHNRSSGNGCPFCSGHRVSDINRLSTRNPEVAREWDFDKNDSAPFDTAVSSHKRVWWKCDEGHSWQEQIYNRTGGYGCPFCSGRRLSDINRLSIRNPEVAREWDFDKNELTPDSVYVYSDKMVWWKCSEGHSWDSTVNNRSSGNGCPFCSGRRVSDINRLSIHSPEVAREWDFDKNELTPDEVTVFSNKKVWWRCTEAHSWKAKINNRSNGNGCPTCAKKFGKIEKRFIESFESRTELMLTAHGMRLNQLAYASGRSGVEVDMIFYYNHNYLLVEYDGSYWHREKTDMDTDKSRALLSLGENILHARIREGELPDLDLAHDRFAQFRHDYHRSEADSIERTVEEIARWLREKIGE